MANTPAKSTRDERSDEQAQRELNVSQPPRDEHRAILKQAEADGAEVQPETYYVIRNQWGEQEYISKSRDDAVQRLRELAGVQIGPAGTPAGHPQPSPIGDPGRTLQEVQAIDPHGIPDLAGTYTRSRERLAEAHGEFVETSKQ